MIKTFKDGCIGIKLEDRGDSHICIRMLIEDDTNWHETDFIVSSYWIDNIIHVLQSAKEYMDNNCKKDKRPDPVTNEMHSWGYKYKEK